MDNKIFLKRRADIQSNLASSDVAILFAAKQMHRNADTEYLFRQNSDFYYCTGFKEQDAILVFYSEQCILFCNDKDLNYELWNGERFGVEKAKELLQVDMCYSLDHFEEKIQSYMIDSKSEIYLAGDSWEIDKFRFKNKILNYKSLSNIIAKYRLIKSNEEISLVQTAVDISVKAHELVMQNAYPGMFEYEALAEFIYHTTKSSCNELAYPAIVAGGSRACTLHYVDNDKKIENNQLLLIDAGAEYSMYAADITRTFPVNGKYTSAQADIYSVVLESQLAAIKTVKPGVTLLDVQDAVLKVIVPALKELSLLKESEDEIYSKHLYRKYYPHSVSHWLGLDVHDAGEYKKDKKDILLQENMLITVEPGLYIPENDFTAPKEFRGIGIRIEDDIQIINNGAKNLSEKLVKSIDGIESLMSKH